MLATHPSQRTDGAPRASTGSRGLPVGRAGECVEEPPCGRRSGEERALGPASWSPRGTQRSASCGQRHGKALWEIKHARENLNFNRKLGRHSHGEPGRKMGARRLKESRADSGAHAWCDLQPQASGIAHVPGETRFLSQALLLVWTSDGPTRKSQRGLCAESRLLSAAWKPNVMAGAHAATWSIRGTVFGNGRATGREPWPLLTVVLTQGPGPPVCPPQLRGKRRIPVDQGFLPPHN